MEINPLSHYSTSDWLQGIFCAAITVSMNGLNSKVEILERSNLVMMTGPLENGAGFYRALERGSCKASKKRNDM